MSGAKPNSYILKKKSDGFFQVKTETKELDGKEYELIPRKDTKYFTTFIIHSRTKEDFQKLCEFLHRKITSNEIVL